jgi:nitrite reductase (NADH) large subunit
MLGLEAANGLLKQGMDATVVHSSDTLMNRQLDRAAGALLKASLEHVA